MPKTERRQQSAERSWSASLRAPSSDGPIVVAVVLGRSGTDAADALAPDEVFSRSVEFSVYTVAATRALAPQRRPPRPPHLRLR